LKDQEIYRIQDIEFRVIHSKRRTLGISVLPDSSVIVRVPYRTTFKTINRIVQEKAAWIIKHRDNYRESGKAKSDLSYISGEMHLFRGKESLLLIEKTKKPYIRFINGTIELGLYKSDPVAVRRLLYKGYKTEALTVFFEILNMVLKNHENQTFKPAGIVIRTMKRRWGSCSGKGTITLSTELIKLPDLYIEYVIIHELCHLKHHNHGTGYYKLLSEIFPEWKQVRKEMRRYIQ
jgi:predicted metal-dependent hydrolase